MHSYRVKYILLFCYSKQLIIVEVIAELKVEFIKAIKIENYVCT